MLQTAGLDAVVHVRSYLLALRIFGAFAVYGQTHESIYMYIDR